MKHQFSPKRLIQKALQNEILITTFFSITCFISIFPTLAPITILLLSLNIIFIRRHLIASITFIAVAMINFIFFLCVLNPQTNQDYKELTKIGFHPNFKDCTISDLNYYSKKIEKYKEHLGDFPYSLGHLALDDKKILVTPDLSYIVSNNNGDITYADYYYERISSTKYYLSAVGPDGIPKTLDDILPCISKDEIKKTGLIKFSIRKDSIELQTKKLLQE